MCAIQRNEVTKKAGATGGEGPIAGEADAKGATAKEPEAPDLASKDQQTGVEGKGMEAPVVGETKEGTVDGMLEEPVPKADEPQEQANGMDEDMADAGEVNKEGEGTGGKTSAPKVADTETGGATSDGTKVDPSEVDGGKVEAPSGEVAGKAGEPKEEDEPAPKEISIMIRSRNTPSLKLRTLAISLDGLLDYDEDDKEEATFELSLFAEGFHEMLMRDYGLIILDALQSERAAARQRKLEEQKRKREDEAEAAKQIVKDEERAAKRVKSEEAAKPGEAEAEQEHKQESSAQEAVVDTTMGDANGASGEAEGKKTGAEVSGELVDAAHNEKTNEAANKDGVGEADAEGCATEAPVGSAVAAGTETEGATVGDGEPGKAQEGPGEAPGTGASVKEANVGKEAKEEDMTKDRGKEKVEEEKEKETDAKEVKKKKRYRVDEKLLLAFRYFDRTGCGYIRCEDLRRMLHNLGRSVPPRTVRELVANVADRSMRYKEREPRVYYRDLTDKEIEEGEG
eukprot:evm.model.scf_3803.1 EVM.evm.TU.scf_3803.1   scf_3803:4028-11146(+)